MRAKITKKTKGKEEMMIYAPSPRPSSSVRPKMCSNRGASGEEFFFFPFLWR